jgi:Zn-dependent metalloprotease
MVAVVRDIQIIISRGEFMSSLAKALSVAILMGTVGQAAAVENNAALGDSAARSRGTVSKRALGTLRQSPVAPRLTSYDRALGVVRQNPAAARLSAYDAFTERGATVDANGTEHVRMDRTYRGLRVIGGDLVVHSRAGFMKGVSQTLAKPINLGVTPKLSADSAITAAGVHFGTAFESVPSASLVVFAARANPRLAYDVLYVGTKKDGTPTRMHYYVDALTGRILDKEDAVHTGTLPGDRYGTGNPPTSPVTTSTTGTGNSLFAGIVPQYTQWNATRRVYEMKDPTRGNTHISDMGNGYRGTGTLVVDGDNKWGNGTQFDRASAAVDAAYGLAQTWDYYKNTFGRYGIRGDGIGALGAVHYSLNYANAFWSNDDFTMAFGDGDGTTIRPLVAIDIVGHEMSHGVTHATADLIYAKESGGLNEATSDIFGTMIEYYANNAKQPPNYVIGEAIFIVPAWNNNIRTMFKPSLDGISDDCFPTAPTRPTWTSSRTARTRTTPRAWPTTSSTCWLRAWWCRAATTRGPRRTWPRATWSATATPAWSASAAMRRRRSGTRR